MRTTVEIKPEPRSALLALAARRREEVLSLAGSLDPKHAKELRQTVRLLRKSWR